MIVISKAESLLVRSKYPEVHIFRCNKQKSKRHHYYMGEESYALEFIAKLRGESAGKPLVRGGRE